MTQRTSFSGRSGSGDGSDLRRRATLDRKGSIMAIMHRSKIDTWLLVVLRSAIIVSLVAAVSVALVLPAPNAWAVALLVAVPGTLLPFWLLSSTYYRIETGRLFISCGPVRLWVQLADITAITPTNNPLSSPALSLDRLRIEYGRGKSVMVSPRDKEAFVQDLRAAGASAV